jgi:glycerol-3-phosphate acyltransferase PlsY
MLVALLDAAKGSTAVGLATVLGAGAEARALAGLGAMLGHVCPVWLRGRGGKGVATAAGVFAVLAPRATLVSVGVFALVVATTRLVSLASLAATVTLAAVVAWARAPGPVIALGLAAGVLVIARHAGNVARLARGTEPRLEPAPRASGKGGCA